MGFWEDEGMSRTYWENICGSLGSPMGRGWGAQPTYRGPQRRIHLRTADVTMPFLLLSCRMDSHRRAPSLDEACGHRIANFGNQSYLRKSNRKGLTRL